MEPTTPDSQLALLAAPVPLGETRRDREQPRARVRFSDFALRVDLPM